MTEQLLEPIVLVDKAKGKESTIVIGSHYSFEDLLNSARRLEAKLYQGDWDLCYLDPETKKPIAVSSENTIGEYVEKDITTFYWNYLKKAKKKKASKASKAGSKAKEAGKRVYEKWERKGRARSNYSASERHTVASGKYHYANLGKRVAAWFIDMMIIGFIAGILRFKGAPCVIATWLYFAFMESSDNEATVGKIIMGLRVKDERGRTQSFGQASVRHFSKWLSSIILGIGYIMAFFTPKHQALHDIIAKSVVVEEVG